jgi:hypothetical protein
MATPAWESLLRTPHPCDHLVQLYNDEGFLGRAVTYFITPGLLDGEAAAIIAIPEHVVLFKEQFRRARVDVAQAIERGQLFFLDADTCLSKFMVDGMPDRAKFNDLVIPLLDRMRASGYENIRLYGEMVNLLWDHNMEATVALEELWNQVLADQGVSLLCAYRIDNFDRHAHRGVLHRISRCHSHFIPVEDYDRLEHAVDRAYADVFGSRGEPRGLRDVITARVPVSGTMPQAQAALFALSGLSPGIADAVLERTRYYYGA